MRRFARDPLLALCALATILFLILFVVYPQVKVVIAPGLQGYQTFFASGPNWLRATQNSLTVMLLSTTSAVILGFVYAYAMVLSQMPGKPFFRIIALLPLLSPPFVVAASYVLLFGPRGMVTFGLFKSTPNILGLWGLWGVQTIAFFPYAYALIADVLERSDPRLEQAARNLGAGPWKVFRSVTLPLARPGLIGATLLIAIYVLEDFGNPALIAGSFTVLPTLAYGLISGFGDFAGASVVSIILLAIAMVLYLVRLRLEGRRSYVTVSGRGTQMPRPPVSRRVSACCFAACSLLAGMIILVYGVLVVSSLVEAFPYNLQLTLKHFEYLQAHFTSLRNSFVYALIAATICSALSLLLAYVIQRKSWPGRGLVDFVAIMPAAVPGIFFGIGYALAFNERGLQWLDRGALITISMIFWNIPVGYRALVAGLQQIDRSIDEAAASMGASGLRALGGVLAPILVGSLDTAFVTAFIRAITTLSVVIFLFTPSTTVATITIFQLVNDFNWGGATAFTVSVIGIALTTLVAIRALTRRRVVLEEVPIA